MTEFRDKIAEFRNLNAEVVAISVDSPYCHKAFAERLGVDFRLLSDFNRAVIPQYGVELPELRGLKWLSKRSVFVVDQNGVVRYRWISEDPSQLPNMREIIQAVQDIAKQKKTQAA